MFVRIMGIIVIIVGACACIALLVLMVMMMPGSNEFKTTATVILVTMGVLFYRETPDAMVMEEATSDEKLREFLDIIRIKNNHEFIVQEFQRITQKFTTREKEILIMRYGLEPVTYKWGVQQTGRGSRMEATRIRLDASREEVYAAAEKLLQAWRKNT